MERNEISPHEVRVFLLLSKNPAKWLSNKDIFETLKDVGRRTVRQHTHKLVELGLVDQAEIFPGHRYRWSEKATQRNKTYVQRLQRAAEVIGLS